MIQQEDLFRAYTCVKRRLDRSKRGFQCSTCGMVVIRTYIPLIRTNSKVPRREQRKVAHGWAVIIDFNSAGQASRIFFARRKRTWGGSILGRGQGGLSLSSGLGTRAERGMAVGIYVSMQGSQFSDKTEGNNV